MLHSMNQNWTIRKNLRRVLAAVWAVCVLVTALPADTALAIDVDYEGDVDPETGAPAGEEEDSGSSRIQISPQVYYDREASCFVYVSNQVGDIYMNIVPGMTVADSVTLTTEEEYSYTLYRDGNGTELTGLGTVDLPGQYVLWIGPADSQSSESITFTIVNGATNALTGLSMPAGFQITGAEKDGVPIEYKANNVNMLDEGYYSICYICPRLETEYEFSAEIDRTPPEVELVGVTDGIASGPVEIAGLGQGDTLTVYRGSRKLGTTKRVTQKGSYTVVVSDPAGNENRYTFQIRLYFNWSSTLSIIVVAALLIAGFVYLRYKKKHLRNH